MVLVYYSIEMNSTYYYLGRFGDERVLGEKNNFGEVLIGLFLVDRLENKLVPYKNSWFAELSYKEEYERRKGE